MGIKEKATHILLVEDEAAHAELIRRAFLSYNEQVQLSVASSLQEARACLDTTSPHLVIADLRLPDGNGAELLPTEGHTHAYPVVIMTSHGDEQVAVEAMKAGALDYVVKSETTLAGMPRIVERTLREWGHITERKQAEDALRESEERFRRIFADSPLGMGVLDEALRLINVNATLCRMIGYTESELVDLAFPDLVHPDDAHVNAYLAKELFKDQIPSFTLELRFRKKSGETIWGRMTASTICDTEGNVLYGLGMVEDITERKRTEEALQESERFAQAIADTTPSLVYIYDVTTRTTVWTNTTYREVLGQFDDDATADDAMMARVHRNSRAPLSTRLEKLEANPNGVWIDAEYKILARDGTWRWLLDRASVFSRDPDGKVTQVIGSAIDITERKQAEEALRTSEANLAEAQQIARLGSWDWHIENNRLYWSDELYRIFGLTPDNPPITFQRFLDHIYPDDRVFVQSKVQSSVTERKAFAPVEFRVCRPDETLRTVRCEGILSMNENGSPIRLFGTIQDITERRQLEREILEISNREQRRIGQDLHDELGQLLTGIGFRVAELEDTLKGQQETKDAAEIGELVQEAITQTRALAHGLNPVSMESGGLRIALVTLTRNIERIYEIPCVLTCPEPLLIDDNEAANHVYRIAQEALNNAIKHGKATRLEVSLLQVGSTTTLTVRDNGIGITLQDLKSGGMGLRNMRYRVSMIHGSFDVRRGKDGGTVVTCQFTSHREE